MFYLVFLYKLINKSKKFYQLNSNKSHWIITLCYKFKNRLYKYLGIAHKYINNYFILIHEYCFKDV